MCPPGDNREGTLFVYIYMYNQDTYQNKIYYGITETKFKQRYSNHIKSFRHWKHQSNTEISSELWSIKNNTYTPKSHGKYLGNSRGITLTPKGTPCF